MQPELLPPNLFQHQYRAGGRIARLRGMDAAGILDQPEEWLGSTTRMLHEPDKGPSRTAAGTLLADVIAADPMSWLGRPDTDSRVLFKLIDAGQRGPVHVHPDADFARIHLDDVHGKTEAWLILEAEPGSAVYAGWRTPVDPDELAVHRDQQDADWMLSRMNRIEVTPGTAVVVPASEVHAVDPGLLIAEVQEPTDYSIVLEWSATTLNRENAELGLGWDLVSEAIDHARLPADRVSELVSEVELVNPQPGVREVFADAASPFFSLKQVVASAGAPSGLVPASFSVVFVFSGRGAIHGNGDPVEVSQGDVLAVPYAYGPWSLSGDAVVLAASGA